ncbi:MAG: DUF917 domain-containing protein [Thermodesulfobacteriota bacterium]
MARLLNKTDISDLCFGTTVLGTGGGGAPELGLFILNRLLEMGKEIRLISVDEVPDDEIVVHPAMVGSIAPSKEKAIALEEYCLNIIAREGPLLTGLKTLEEALAEKVYATVPVELGGYNTPVAAILGALAGISFVDADTIGRAKPELMMQTYTVHHVPMTPMVLTDMKGNSVLVRKVANFEYAEKIARAMAVVGGGTMAVRCPVKGDVLKKTIIPGGVTKAIEIGRALRGAEERREDPVRAVIRASGGTEFFRGTVREFEWEDRDGFLWGTITVEGEDRYQKQELRVWLKNENLLSWLDGEPYVLTPDLICILDAQTGEPITNSNMREGKRIVVFGIPCHPFWRTEEAIDLVSPKHFGFDIPYRPMEEILKAKS